MKKLFTLKETGDLKGKRVLLRLDLNVPIENGEVRDAYRIESCIPTLNYLRAAGARTIIIAHLGKGKPEETLKPIATYLRDTIPMKFLPKLLDPDNKLTIEKMEDGDVVLLENLRHSKGEEENSDDLAKYLASLGEVYVNDAFAVSHRAHASVVGIPKYLYGSMGFLFEREVEELSKAFNPEHPFLFILGGAKISTKLPLLKKFLSIADHIFVGGANANNFFKARGYEVGTSVIDEDAVEGIESYANNPKLLIPSDVVVREGKTEKPIEEVGKEEMIVDVGQIGVETITKYVHEAKLIVWNGPLGFYEEGFTEGSKKLLELIAHSKARSIIGGGDTVALVDAIGAHDKFSFVSTGGGAMLDFLSEGTLPGIEALKR